MAKRTVLHDRVGWMEGDQAQYASRGQVVDIPDSEVERLDGLGAVGPEDARLQAAGSAAAAVPPGTTFTPLTAEQVHGMSVQELRGYLAARPDQGTYVASLEATRPEGERRSTVLGFSPTPVLSDQPTVDPAQGSAPNQQQTQGESQPRQRQRGQEG